MKLRHFLTLLPIASIGLYVSYLAAEPAKPAKPLKVLIVAGGCCHDYDKQRLILAEGLSSRSNIEVEFAYNPDKGTAPKFEIYDKPDWYKGFDVIVHDECAASVKDPETVNKILAAHKEGVPGVNLHCAMHSYRVSNQVGKPIQPGTEESIWFDYLGLQSSGHGPQEPIAITYVDKKHPVTVGLEDWTTIKEELYNNVQDPKVYPKHHTLATGKQTVKNKDGTTKDVEAVITWTNEYGPKQTRVFNTTIGHNNDTVADGRYLDLITRAVLWSAHKLTDDGKPQAGYQAITH